jgi:phosphopantetheinyl transferase
MPLVYQQNINAATKLAVWHITEPEDFFLEKVMLQKEITHVHKRLQHLAGRFMLKLLFPDFPVALIKIADTKKPFLIDEAYHFSISHCGDYAAAIVSKTNRVGIDVELISSKAERVHKKFLTEAEFHLLQNSGIQDKFKLTDEAIFTLAWNIKETLFKWNGAAKIDFKAHLKIEKISFDESQNLATCLVLSPENVTIKLQFVLLSGYFLSWGC